MTGRTIAHYRILEKLGEGGMGVVYKAEDIHLQRTVALKFLHAGEDTARLLREARAAALLNHPNICTVHEVAPEDGFLAMELVEGESLTRRIGGRPLRLEEAVRLAIQIGEGLKAAHEKGIIHRDVKSGNILVTKQGQAKILDFGLARLTGQTVLTLEGTVAGTPGYMAPEQMRGEAVDRRTDIWALGAVLHEMLVGRLPMGQTETLPEGVGRVVRKALAANPRERYQHVEDLLVDLRRVAAFPGAKPSGRRRLWAAAAPAGLAVVVLGGYLYWPRNEGFSWKNATFTQLTSQPGEEYYPSLSPDGKSFLYASQASGNWDIYLQRVGGKNAVNLTMDSPADDTEPAFSPDGERIAFRSERDGGGVFLMGATGESVTRLTEFGHNPAWSPDGQAIVCATGGSLRPEGPTIGSLPSQLFIVPAHGSAGSSDQRLITAEIGTATHPTWSPGGRQIAFLSKREIWMLAVNGGRPVQLTHDPAADWFPVWSPDGRYLYFLSNRSGSMNLWRVAVDEDSGRAVELPEQVTTPSADTLHFSFARAGRSLVYVNQVRRGNIYKVDFDPARERVLGPASPVTRGSWRALCPDVSPDGQWVAFSTWTKPENLFVCRVDGRDLRQLTDGVGWDLFPRWSPDGQRLAFMSNRGGANQIWTIAPDGRSLQQLTRIAARSVLNAAWSPDGARLAFNTENRSTMVMEVGRPWDERSLEILPSPEPPEQFVVFSWSPDGQRLAGSRAGGKGISVYSLDSRRYQHFTGFGRYPRWLSDSRRLIFGTPGEPGIYLLDTRTGKVLEIFSVAPNGVHLVSPTRDDRRIYFGLGSIEADIWMMSVEK